MVTNASRSLTHWPCRGPKAWAYSYTAIQCAEKLKQAVLATQTKWEACEETRFSFHTEGRIPVKCFHEQTNGVPAKALGSVAKLLDVNEPMVPVYSLANDTRPSTSISSHVK